MDLIFTTKEGLIRHLKVMCSLDYSDHVMVRFMILQGKSEAKSRTTNLVFRTTDFGLFRICWEESHGIWPWKEKSVQEKWLIFKLKNDAS